MLVTLLLACGVGVAATSAAPPLAPGQAQAVFAGGCFWCMERDFEQLPGVIDAVSGYTGGQLEGPTYAQVSSHATHHIEAVRIVYDPAIIDYVGLLDYFWRHIDPTQEDGQFCDRGEQYRAAIFTSDPVQVRAAEASRAAVAARLGVSVVTTIRPAETFWVAESYHQDFYQKNPERYHRYREDCGRDARTRALWGG